MNSNPHDMDGVDLWFFGGTPGPDDLDEACTLKWRSTAQIDEDDARIPSFAHRCHCGEHRPGPACATKVSPMTPREDQTVLMSFPA